MILRIRKNGAFVLCALCALFLALGDASADEVDDLFKDAGSVEVVEGATINDPESTLYQDEKLVWGGELNAKAGSQVGFEDALPDISDPADGNESLLFDFNARLWFDSRPNRVYRVFGKLTADYPFDHEAQPYGSRAGDEAITVANIRVFELFTDYNWKDRVFFRFGKQNTGWGISRFYQVADPISVGVKDPGDPEADLEGPIALKVSIPFGLNSLVLISALKDSYIPDGVGRASVTDLGVGAKVDMHIEVPDNRILGNGQLSLGTYYQRDLAPKAVLSYSTNVQKVQLFTDQALSWGLDSYRLSGADDWIDPDGEGPLAPTRYAATEKPDDRVFYSATLGSMYVNTDWHFTLYAEYLYVGSGSSDARYYEDWLARYGAEQVPSSGLDASLTKSDIGGYLSMHNSAASVSWSELFGDEDFSFTAYWLQNWVDKSGMVKPSFAWSPVKYLIAELGATCAWGRDNTEWGVKNTDSDSGNIVRTAGYLAFKLKKAKF